MEKKKFEVGKVYAVYGYDSIKVLVTKRTEKFITYTVVNTSRYAVYAKDIRKKIQSDCTYYESVDLTIDKDTMPLTALKEESTETSHYTVITMIADGRVEEAKAYKKASFEALKAKVNNKIKNAASTGDNVDVESDVDVESEEVDASEYAVTAEAQDAAIKGEIENAARAAFPFKKFEVGKVYVDRGGLCLRLLIPNCYVPFKILDRAGDKVKLSYPDYCEAEKGNYDEQIEWVAVWQAGSQENLMVKGWATLRAACDEYKDGMTLAFADGVNTKNSKETAAAIVEESKVEEIVEVEEIEEDKEKEENTEIDSRIKDLVAIVSMYDAEIKKLHEKIAVLQAKRGGVCVDIAKHQKNLEKFNRETVKFNSDSAIELISQDSFKTYNFDSESYRDGVELKAEISTYDGLIEVYIDINGDEMVPLATYQSVTKFKAAIRELAAAIKRGDKQFKLPADVQGK